MKKITLFVLAATLTSAAFSQVKWGLQATGNLSAASFTAEEGISTKKTSLLGFGAGVSAELPLSSSVSLRTSLGLLQKGVTINAKGGEDGGVGSVDVKLTNKLYYAELPLNIAFNKEVTSGKFFIGAGPSIGYGLFGKSKGTYTVTVPGTPQHTETESVDAFKTGDDGGGYKRFDLSANLVAGMQFNSGLYVQAGYLMGLTNSLPKDADGSYKSRGLQLTIGMFLKN